MVILDEEQDSSACPIRSVSISSDDEVSHFGIEDVTKCSGGGRYQVTIDGSRDIRGHRSGRTYGTEDYLRWDAP